jgi:putative sigma-54 modulation protein
VQIKISARHGHLAEATQQFIHAKAEKLLHLFDRITLIEVTVDLQGEFKKVEFKVLPEHKHEIVATAEAKDLLAAVDTAEHKIEMQLRRFKEKLQDHRRDQSASQVAGVPQTEEPGEE